MKFRPVFYLVANLLFILGGFLFVPAAVSLYFREIQTAMCFVWTTCVSVGVGGVLFLQFRSAKDEGIDLRDGFLLVTLSWLLISIVGSLPFYFSPYFTSYVDAFFESTSGFTTTGASILSDIESLPHGLLFWRNLSQWIGGMGIIVLAVAVLPQLSVGGIQLMKNEMPGPTFEQLKPRIKQTALSLWKVYLLFSLLQVFALCFAGMPIFESILHMFGTMSTGGFSPRNASVGAYDSTTIQMIFAVFMFLAGTNFVLHYYNLKGDVLRTFKDSEWLFFTGLIFVAFIVIVICLSVHQHMPGMEAMRLAIFQVLSIVTTTGFMTADFDAWPHLAAGILFLLMFVGGCAGSTSGGLKQIRLLLFFKRARQSIIQHIFPKAVIAVKVNKRAVSESVLHGISSLFLIYLVLFSFCTLIILAFNIDFVTATSSVVACLSNIGPGFNGVGPTQNYAFYPDLVKYLLCFCMIVGRLEIFTVLVLFFPETWRR